MEDNITADMDNITAASPLTPYPYPIIATSLFKFFAVIQFLFSLFCLFMVIYLSVRLKKKAWDSPAKRFGHILNVLVSLIFFAVGLFNALYSKFSFFSIALYISISFPHLFFLYLMAIYVSRLLQIVSPFLNERLKQCTRKTHCAIITEVVCHILLPVIFIVLTPLAIIVYFIGNLGFFIGVESILIVFVLLFSSCLIFASVFLMKRFLRSQNIASSIKHMIIKLIFILIIYISFSIGAIIIVIISFYIDILISILFS